MNRRLFSNALLVVVTASGALSSGLLVAGAADAAPKPKESRTGSASWKEVFSLPSSETRTLLGMWADEQGTVCAVGDRIIVQGTVGDRFDVTSLPAGQLLYDVWGTDAGNLFGVGRGQLILRFADKKWTPDHPITAGNPRRLLLYSVGPFLPGGIVAYGPGPEGLKRVSGAWQPLKPDELAAISRRDSVVERADSPCRSGVQRTGATRAGDGWIICQDRTVFLKRKQELQRRGRAPARCMSGQRVYGAVVWNEDLFVLCDKEVWRNHDAEWVREDAPTKAHGLFSTRTCLYAFGDRTIMARC